MASIDYLKILRTLAEHEVEYIVVGGVSAVLQGATVNAFDVDVVHRRSPENIQRALAALAALDAYYRFQPARRLRPGTSHLQSPGHQLLMTSAGPLDLHGTIGESFTYDDLVDSTERMSIGEGFSVRVLQLERLIAIKEDMGGDKDLAVLPTLRRALEEKRRRR